MSVHINEDYINESLGSLDLFIFYSQIYTDDNSVIKSVHVHHYHLISHVSYFIFDFWRFRQDLFKTTLLDGHSVGAVESNAVTCKRLMCSYKDQRVFNQMSHFDLKS